MPTNIFRGAKVLKKIKIGKFNSATTPFYSICHSECNEESSSICIAALHARFSHLEDSSLRSE